MSKKEHTLFVEKYRPTTLDTYLCDDDLRGKFEDLSLIKTFHT